MGNTSQCLLIVSNPRTEWSWKTSQIPRKISHLSKNQFLNSLYL